MNNFAYYDHQEQPNLHHLSRDFKGEAWLVFDHPLTSTLERNGYTIKYDRVYDKGIYIVSLRNYSPFWSGNKPGGHARHVLYELPFDVLNAARKRKLIIVLDNQSEGFPLVYDNCDGFLEMHLAMTNLQLPKDSVIFVDGNKEFETYYHIWCANNYCRPLISHVYFFTHLFYFNQRPAHPLIIDALKKPESKDFCSLNRTMRMHRLEHLYTIIKDGLHTQGLVSGHWANFKEATAHNIPLPVYLDIEKTEYKKVLMDHLPLEIDGNWNDMYGRSPDDTVETQFNFRIYASSLLSFVTETAFHWPGMFLTEKIFKPIAAGQPFIVLGQQGILRTLKDMGYQTDFEGIDQSYDDIKDPYQRFHAAHKSLKEWIAIPRGQKTDLLMRSMRKISHNQQAFYSHNYEAESYDRLKTRVKEIFETYSK